MTQPGSKIYKEIQSKDGDLFTIQPMLENDYSQCVKLCTNAFVKNNAVIMHLNIPEPQLYEHFEEHLRPCMESGLSLVVKSSDNSIASMLFLETFNIYDTYTPPLESGMQPLYRIGKKSYLEAVTKNPEILQAAARYMTMRVNMGATDVAYDGHGLGTQLRLYVETHARDLGYECITVEPISNATRHIYEKFEWTLLANVTLANDVDKNGSRPFDGLDEGERYTIFMKNLSPSPVYSKPIAWCVLAALKLGLVR
ncbi:hypothetical protein SARC_11692 [Sphaeroforma arctica JP610]|uniref:N-acetyltransferase domain-containing protein n=1 Tax=Sphaeroforma arctica JP610 TaxID=667725 RepID=A0A0L0FIC4_9EUKA|nr:hypothetical protein SARC_11692 [Sphaeroforma arctica JP610]KNC75788.1 hypothetical protein SARC_11692 [Sphaeroforma arctica JP610]|eukprot:XP_014149690.1 hypothetical protein SARC_11692 [Sphaeroforma arctica JP610]